MLPEKAEIEAKIKELQAVLRIQDWDIEFQYCTELEMQEFSGSKNNLGCCARNRKNRWGLIKINQDHKDIPGDWYRTLVHEMFHVVTDDFQYHAACLLDKVGDDEHETWKNVLDMHYERLVDNLARGFVNDMKREEKQEGMSG